MRIPFRMLLLATVVARAPGAAADDVLLQAIPDSIGAEAAMMAAPPPLPLPLGGGDTLSFLQLELSGPADIVPGKPYAARLTVTSRQPLVDGNSITVEHHARLYRDADGRTRRDDEPGPATARRERAYIFDPVARASWLLDPASRHAERLPHASRHGTELAFASALVPGATGERTVSAPAAETYASTGPVFALPAQSAGTTAFAAGIPITLPLPGAPRTESLGTRTIEELEAAGTRTVVTIPAQAIGNAAPIEIVTEQWYSPELGMVLLSEHRDPRVGETRFRLHDIRRTTPDPQLFSVPSGYTVTDPALGAP